MSDFPHLAAQIFNRPLAIESGKAQIILAALAGRLGIARVQLPNGSLRALAADAEAMTLDELPDDGSSGYQVISGVAVIGVQGTLVQRQLGLRPISGMTGYNAIRLNFVTAIEDPEVRAIAFDIDSPGGDVAGLFDLTDEIYAARGRKPVWALLNEFGGLGGLRDSRRHRQGRGSPDRVQRFGGRAGASRRLVGSAGGGRRHGVDHSIRRA